MTRDNRRLLTEPGPGWRRRVLPLGLVLVTSAGLAGCGEDPPALTPDVTAEELQAVEDDVAALEERVADLEAAQSSAPPSTGETSAPPSPTPSATPAEPTVPFSAGEDVSFGGQVAGLIATTAIGSAFRVTTDSGAAVTVVSATPVDGLEPGEVVQVSGTATSVEPSSFERDFGIAAAVLLDEPDAFLAEQTGQLAVAADDVQQETAG
ncbi:hypothetical protein O2V63_12420 [Modestobacter sp. VKM Ac-2977]|uniref:hypothetical protein n=1 Tax=Modestobacter sp. VKM Ac-2977 TaxID=3004131 RepID=UPI0022A9F7E2|nr:hypothetical protein [Modestobacter sp. VKM Ac-2977]MCZ2821139.1 hypothetical protein [Modestobacter sp. VKM Ac-2977]